MRRFLNKFLFEREMDSRNGFWDIVFHVLKQIVIYLLFYGGICFILLLAAKVLSVMVITLFQ